MLIPGPETEIAQLKRRYDMRPIPGEGAFFAAGPRLPGLSAVLVLLTDEPDGASARHRLSCDEGWQWLDGAPVELSIASESIILDDRHPQAIVAADAWQSARTAGPWSLVSCWCAPSFDRSTFET